MYWHQLRVLLFSWSKSILQTRDPCLFSQPTSNPYFGNWPASDCWVFSRTARLCIQNKPWGERTQTKEEAKEDHKVAESRKGRKCNGDEIDCGK